MIRLFIFLVLLSACSNESSSYEHIALDIIKNNPTEDIFMIEDSVYKKSESDKIYEFVDSEVSSLGDITERYNGGKRFENGMATKLAVGTLIYKSNTENTIDNLYIKVNENYLEYILQIEG